ncbi:MAG: hypothetical protein M3362_06310 [Acidobacteriota bacterium]|nr:hypothetical protein [Acidobacteriota bacterium]
MGKSRRADMLRVFGRPLWSRSQREEEEDSKPEVWNNYEGIGEFPGQANVVVDKRSGIITRIDFFPKKLTKEQAIAHFGQDYVITRYDFEPCSDDEESEPIYESPNGPLVSLEYRQRGIAIAIGHGDLVTKISYVSGPIGTPQSRCRQ